MQEKIIKRAVDGISPGPRDIFIWDSEVTGFGLEVRPAGTKWYVLKYRSGGRQRWSTIGRHGAPWTPDLARRRAVGLLGQIVRGEDPAEMRDRVRRSQLPDSKVVPWQPFSSSAMRNGIIAVGGKPKGSSVYM